MALRWMRSAAHRAAARAAARTGAGVLIAGLGLSTHAAQPQEAHGYWRSADQAAVIEFKECADAPGALCGQIVWDKDMGTATDACGVRIAKLKKWDGEAWREGWVHDPRDKKNYKGVARVKGDVLALRAYIGTEVLGETEEMRRTTALPSPACPR